MRIKGLLMLGAMITVTIIYLFAGDFKGCTGTWVGDRPTRDAKTGAAEKK